MAFAAIVAITQVDAQKFFPNFADYFSQLSTLVSGGNGTAGAKTDALRYQLGSFRRPTRERSDFPLKKSQNST
jgi:hypothetical protein